MEEVCIIVSRTTSGMSVFTEKIWTIIWMWPRKVCLLEASTSGWWHWKVTEHWMWISVEGSKVTGSAALREGEHVSGSRTYSQVCATSSLSVLFEVHNKVSFFAMTNKAAGSTKLHPLMALCSDTPGGYTPEGSLPKPGHTPMRVTARGLLSWGVSVPGLRRAPSALPPGCYC